MSKYYHKGYIATKALAKMLKISPSSVRDWSRAGILPQLVTMPGSGLYLFCKEDSAKRVVERANEYRNRYPDITPSRLALLLMGVNFANTQDGKLAHQRKIIFRPWGFALPSDEVESPQATEVPARSGIPICEFFHQLKDALEALDSIGAFYRDGEWFKDDSHTLHQFFTMANTAIDAMVELGCEYSYKSQEWRA